MDANTCTVHNHPVQAGFVVSLYNNVHAAQNGQQLLLTTVLYYSASQLVDRDAVMLLKNSCTECWRLMSNSKQETEEAV